MTCQRSILCVVVLVGGVAVAPSALVTGVMWQVGSGDHADRAGHTPVQRASMSATPHSAPTESRSRTSAASSSLNVAIQVEGVGAASVASGAEVLYEIVGELSGDANEGLAFFQFDLEFDGGDLPEADSPTDFPMRSFAIPEGFTNPTGFGGVTNVPGREGDLVQVGGAQNVIKNTADIAPYPVGTVTTGVAWPGSPQVLVTGTLIAPLATGTYTLRLTNLAARVIKLGETGESFWATEPTGPGTITNLTIHVPAIQDCSGNRGDQVIVLLEEGSECWNGDPCMKHGLCNAANECIAEPEYGTPCLKPRYISLVPVEMGETTAIRVELTSLHHPAGAVDPSDFSDWEGGIRWVNALNETHTCPDSPVFSTTFRCASLGCEPEYREWAGELGGDILHITAASVVPSSEYTVTQLAGSCIGNEESCAEVSEAFSILTADHGDVGPVDPLLVVDCARVVDHLKGKPGSPIKPRVHLQPNVPDAFGERVTVLDVATVVDALKNRPYGFAGDFGPCTDACPGETPCP